MTAFALNPDERATIMAADGVDQIIFKPLPPFAELRQVLEAIIQSKYASNQRS
jgi:hypothetical protein